MTATLQAMEQLGMRRLISLTGTGVRFPGDIITPIDKIMNVSIGLIDPARIRDGRNQVDVVRSSDVYRTFIRVLKLTNQPAGAFVLTRNGPAKTFVPIEEVAQAILQELTDKRFVHQAPIISPASHRSR